MNNRNGRWFEPSAIQAAVSFMQRTFGDAPPPQSNHVRNEREHLQTKSTMIAVGGAVAFLAIVITVGLLFTPNAERREADYGSAVFLCLGIVSGAGAITYVICGKNNRQRGERDEAFEELCRRYPGLRPARRTEIEDSSVGTIPWYHSEEWSHTYGLVSGEYDGSQMIAVECTHVVDPILVTTDSRWMQGLAGVVSNRHQRLFLRAMHATIFVEPLPNVPDLLFVPQMDPSRAYYKRALERQSCDLSDVFKLPRKLRRKYWMAAAEPEVCGGLLASELPGLLASRRWCIVQVVGGHCVVMTSQWHGNYPSRAPRTAEAIAEDLAFARAVYRQLRQISTGVAATGAAVAEYTGEPTPVAAALAEATTACETSADDSAEPARVGPAVAVARRTEPRRRRPHSILVKLCLLGIGLPLLLVGLLATIGIVADRQRGREAAGWPQADARIVDSGMDVNTFRLGGKEVMRYKPRVSYEYEVGGQRFTGHRIKYGVTSATKDKHEVERVLARYGKDALVKVRYMAECRGISVLEPGLQQEMGMLNYLALTGAFMLTGLLMSGYAFIGKRIRPMP